MNWFIDTISILLMLLGIRIVWIAYRENRGTGYDNRAMKRYLLERMIREAKK